MMIFKFKLPKSPVSKTNSKIKRSVKNSTLHGYSKGTATAISNPKNILRKIFLSLFKYLYKI